MVIKKIRIVCLVGLLITTTSFGAMFEEEHTARQEYHDVNSPKTDTTTPSTPTESPNEQMIPTNAAAAMTNTAPAPMPDPRIDVLSDKLNLLTLQVDALNKTVTTFSQQMLELKTAQNTAQDQKNESIYSQFSTWVQTAGPAAYVNLLGAALLLLIVGFLLGLLNRHPHRKQAHDNHATASTDPVEPLADTDVEYDFMATDQAIPAQLDLARSYVAMDDNDQAKIVLEKVMTRGNAAQKAEAQALLDEIANRQNTK